MISNTETYARLVRATGDSPRHRAWAGAAFAEPKVSRGAAFADFDGDGKIDIVVASLGSATPDGAEMGVPNGELDTWADIVVAQKFRYVQVSTYYDQAADVPASWLSQLPANSFTSWIQSKQPNIANAFDQVAVQAVAIPSIISTETRAVQQGENSNNMPVLLSNTNGPDWLVSQTSSALATARFWEMLLDPATFDSQRAYRPDSGT